MDEGNARYRAGQQGDGTVHRVGLTRHCIASGLVQLPFALRDTFPEGELLALDVERDEPVVLESVPPRRLAGLAEFFVTHELEVNDQLEIRVRGHDAGEVRLVAVRNARRPARSEDRRLGAAERGSDAVQAGDPRVAPSRQQEAPALLDDASTASNEGTAPLPDTAVQDALEHGGWSTVRTSLGGPDVVETIGSVTVRRLGAGRFSSPPVTTLARPAPNLDGEAPSSRDARLGADASSASDTEAAVPIDQAVDAGADAVFEPSAGSEPELDALLVVDNAPVPPPEAERPPSADEVVRQPGLFAPRDAGRPPFPAPPRARSAPRRPAQPFVAPARSAPVALSEEDLADPDRAAPDRAAPRRAESEGEQVVRQRAREEELSRAGDLRSRIVRWLLAPSTPVIVPIERVQHAFDLPVDVAREVVEGVLEAPPPSLRLTRLREDLLRVSRVTIEQDA